MLFFIKIIPPERWNPIKQNFDFERDESKTFPVVFQDVIKCKSDPEKLYVWNSSKLKTKHMTLRQYCEEFGNVGGVTTHLSYVGSFGSRFSWHVEDMNLSAISLMLFGMPKIWYLIPPHDGPKLEALQKKHQKWPSTNCTHPLRHKSNCFDPNFVRSQGIEVFKVNRNIFLSISSTIFIQHSSIFFNQIIQNPKEIVVIAPSAYHSGMNVGLNFAATVNFAFEDWVEEGQKFETCQCLK